MPLKGSGLMAEYGMFKTALRGFRKEDVLAYIDEMLAERSRQELELQGQIEVLQKQLAEAQVQKEAVLENERLTTQLAECKGQVEVLTAQVAEVTAQLEEERGASEAATMRDAELSEQLEQSHQAIAALWEEKAELQKQINETTELIERLHAVGTDFCRQVAELLPEQEGEATESPVEPPLVVDMPSAEPSKPMERWLF